MPYINPNRRLELIDLAEVAEVAGELNFQITQLIKNYWEYSGRNYQAINDIVGVLEGAKLEFYRRIVSKYEDGKIIENGDIY